MRDSATAPRRYNLVWFQAVVWGLLMVMLLLPALIRDRFAWQAQLLWVSGWTLTGLLVSTLAGRGLSRLPDPQLRGARLALVALLTSIVGSAGWTALLQLVELVIGRDPMAPPVMAGSHYLFFSFARGFFLLGLWSALFLTAELSWRVQLAREHSVRAQAAANQAQLQLLRSQLNPHFLFNALNSVVALINEDPAAARTMVRDVATLLRRSLDTDGRRDTTLQDDVEFVQLYVKCEQVRFEERLRVKFDIASDVTKQRVPPMLLHPLVENAVKHGMHQAAGKPIDVSIIARRENGLLHLEVSNDGALTAATGGLPMVSGIGLRNVRERLATLFPNRHRFEVSERGGRVVAVIELPLEGAT